MVKLSKEIDTGIRYLLVILCVLIILSSAISAVHAVNIVDSSASANPGVFPPNSKPYGLTYGEWTAKWWQWAKSIPLKINPIVDKTGANCAQNQSGPVWFLAGTQGGPPLERTCIIPNGRSILFPVINNFDSFADNPLLKTESQMREDIKGGIDHVTHKEATIDGISINLDNFRIQSPLFNFTYPQGSTSGAPAGPSQAVSDGYWIMLRPLPPGKHDIHFRGELVDFTTTGMINFATDVTYHLIVS